MRWSRIFFAGLAASMALIALCLYTPAGTGLLLVAARAWLPGELAWEWAEGVPAGPLRIHGLSYADRQEEIRIAQVEFDWRPWRLGVGELRIRHLRLRGLRWQLDDTGTPAEAVPAGDATPSPRVPLSLVLQAFRIEDAEVVSGKGAPFRIPQLQGRGQQVGGDLRLAVRGALGLAGRPPIQLRARLAGTLQQARIEAHLSHPALAAPLEVRGGLQRNAGTFRWEGISLRSGRFLKGTSDGEWQTHARRFRARLRWQRVGWPMQGNARFWSDGGWLHLHGRLEAWRLEAAFALAGDGVPDSHWSVEGKGNRAGMPIVRLEGQLLEGVLHGEGKVAWAPRLDWSLQLEGEALDPAAWPRPQAVGWPGRLDFRLQATGKAGRATLDLRSLSGMLRERPLRAQGRLRIDREGLALENLHLQSGDSRLDARGGVGRSGIGLEWEVRVRDLGDLLPDAAGKLSGRGRVSGQRDRPLWSGRLRIAGLRYRGLRWARGEAYWRIGFGRESPLHLVLQGEGLRSGAMDWQQVGLAVEGTATVQRIRVTAKGGSGRVLVRAQGRWENERVWQGVLEQADWLDGPPGSWRLEAPATLRWAGGRLHGTSLCWRQAAARFCLTPATENGIQQVRVRLQALPLRRLAPLAPQVETLALKGRLSLELVARFGAGAPDAEGRLCLSPGSLRTALAGQEHEETFEGGCLMLRQGRDGLHAWGTLGLEERDDLRLRIELPGYRPGAPLDTQPIDADLQLAMLRLERLAPWIDGIDRLEGRLQGECRLGGTLGNPRYRLALHLKDGVLGLPATGVDWQAVEADIVGSDAAGGLRLQAAARSGEGSLAVRGRLSGRLPADWSLRLRIEGRQFLVADLPDARLVVSPDLSVQMQPHRIRIDGTVRVPHARLRPRQLVQPVAVSPDAVLVEAGGSVQARTGWQVRAELRLLPGEDVWFEARGLKARLGGDLTILERGEGVPLGRGSLLVREGTYRLQGTPLTIRRGRLLYADTPLEAPGLDIVLERKTPEAVVKAHVSGTLRAPVLRLSSDPPLPQTDRLSLLLTGQRLSEASPAQGDLLLQAARELGLAGGNLLGRRLASALGLTEARVTLGERLDEAALALGAWLSPRLYVSWTLGLFDPVAGLQIRYRLGRHLQLEVRSGLQGTGGDLLYTIER